MHINIHIHSPRALASALACTATLALGAMWLTAPTQAQVAEELPGVLVQAGGDDFDVPAALSEAQEDVRRSRITRAVLERREEVLRYEVQVLREQRRQSVGRVSSEEYEVLVDAERRLQRLLFDKYEAESVLLTAMNQLWEAEERGGRIGNRVGERKVQTLQWPVEPIKGLSAHFMDSGYEKVFGVAHKAIDIPTPQGTIVHAAADGVVETVKDNGFGYSYIIVSHGGTATLYGHLSDMLVQEGQSVKGGEPIALSGGTPGTKGAGTMTTGAHLHFEAIEDGVRIDPLPLLPDVPTVSKD